MRPLKRSKISRKSKKRYTKRGRNILKITKKKKLSKKNVKKNYKKRYSQKNKKKMILSGGSSNPLVMNPVMLGDNSMESWLSSNPLVMDPVLPDNSMESWLSVVEKDLIGMGYDKEVVEGTVREVFLEYPDLFKSNSGMEKFKKKVLKKISDKYYESGKLNDLPGAGVSSSYGAIEDHIQARQRERGYAQNLKQLLGMEMRDDGTKRRIFSRRNKDLTEEEKEQSRSIQEKVKSEDSALRRVDDIKDYDIEDYDIQEFMFSTGVSDPKLADKYLRAAGGNKERAKNLLRVTQQQHRAAKQQHINMARAMLDYTSARDAARMSGQERGRFSHKIRGQRAANKLRKIGGPLVMEGYAFRDPSGPEDWRWSEFRN